MAVYHKDDPQLFQMALESVYANTAPPTEVILVQDGPIGSALSGVIDNFRGRTGFNCVELGTNCGLATALNMGLRHVSTPYVFRADADDQNLADRFEKQLSFLSCGYDLVGGAILEVDRKGKPIAIKTVPGDEASIHNYICRRNPFNHMTVAFRTQVALEMGGYPDIYLKEDYALWALMIANGAKVRNVDDILVHATAGRDMYRRRGGFKYVYSEVKLQEILVRYGLQPPILALIIGIIRSFVFLIPVGLRGAVYERFLRKSVKQASCR